MTTRSEREERGAERRAEHADIGELQRRVEAAAEHHNARQSGLPTAAKKQRAESKKNEAAASPAEAAGGPGAPKDRVRGPATLGGSREAKRAAATVLEVISGLRSTADGAAALGVTPNRYYQLELRALEGMIEALEPRRPHRGRRPSPENEIERLKRERDRLSRELARSQALVRLAHRSIGLPSPSASGAAGGKTGKRRRRRVAPRSKLIAEALRREVEPTERPAPAADDKTPEGDGRDVA